MHLIISIIIGIVFVTLLGKAILETIWGTFLIIYGVLWQIVGVLLLAAAWIIDKIHDIRNACNKKNSPDTNACKMWAARATLTVLIIALLGIITLLTYKSLCLISMIDWQPASDWIHDAIKN